MGNHYRLEKKLHDGTLSSVWLARHVALGREVVVKFFRCPDKTQRQLIGELSSLCRLQHPHNVHVIDTTGRVEGPEGSIIGPFLVMEHVPGQTLRRILRTQRRLAPLQAWRVALQVLAALSEAHGFGIVHGDIKPENLMLWEPEGLDRLVKVIDYGLTGGFAGSPEQGVLTSGTPQYMAPEVAMGHAPSPSSDLYSLGIVLYEALAGSRPFNADDPHEVMQQQIHSEPVPLRALAPIPEELSRLVHRALRKDPAARFASAQELLGAMRALTWRELSRYQFAAFSPIAAEESIATDRFTPQASDAASGLLGDPVQLIHADRELPTPSLNATDTTLAATATPTVWVLTGDPTTEHLIVEEAVSLLSPRCEVSLLSPEARESQLARFLEGRARPPWVVVFGDMHVLIQDALLSKLRWYPETTKVLLSSHLNPELLQTTVNFVGLDQHLTLPSDARKLVAAVNISLERSRKIHHSQDQLRLALRDAIDDLETAWRAAHSRNLVPYPKSKEATG